MKVHSRMRVYTAKELFNMRSDEWLSLRRKFRAEAGRLGLSVLDAPVSRYASLAEIVRFQDTIVRARARRNAARVTIQSMMSRAEDGG